MKAAFEELYALADGVQLTPGNHPTPGFRAHVAGRVTRTHHGFDFEHRLRAVWRDGRCVTDATSVHPPETLEEMEGATVTLETMYPGHRLGSGEELAWAMARGLSLAVDVSHLFIQRTAGVLDDRTLARLLDYDRIEEVHCSANDGRRDAHASMRADSFGLDWARARLAAGTPVIVECYMHKMSVDDRRRQVALVRGG
jgi:sugar phosphate isomerase/epimerase